MQKQTIQKSYFYSLYLIHNIYLLKSLNIYWSLQKYSVLACEF